VASGRPLRGEKGEIIGGVVVIRDITAQKRAAEFEKELRSTKEELAVAGKIQRKLFPGRPPRIDGLDIAGASVPAVATGGDYFDYIEMPDGHLVAVVGDVSGHGVGPALIMASTRAYLHAILRSTSETSGVLRTINRLLVAETAAEDFVTLILTRIDPEARTLEYASAGHPTCYVVDAQNRIKFSLESTGPPLGVLADAEFDRGTVRLDDGDHVVLLTDGILEAEHPNGDPFGVDRALDVVRANSRRSASEILSELRGELSRSCPGTQQDDLTAVIIGVEPRTAPVSHSADPRAESANQA
jgi:sigma-B regulation protein RsbU (phosphoserine phosphatase)